MAPGSYCGGRSGSRSWCHTPDVGPPGQPSGVIKPKSSGRVLAGRARRRPGLGANNARARRPGSKNGGRRASSPAQRWRVGAPRAGTAGGLSEEIARRKQEPATHGADGCPEPGELGVVEEEISPIGPPSRWGAGCRCSRPSARRSRSTSSSSSAGSTRTSLRRTRSSRPAFSLEPARSRSCRPGEQSASRFSSLRDPSRWPSRL